MCNLSTAQEKFIKAAMKKNEEISDAEHFKANGSWNKLKSFGEPDVCVAELNSFITYERIKKRFDFSNLTPKDKQNIIKTNDYALSNGCWFNEIESIAVALSIQGDSLKDETTFLTAAIILGLAHAQRENLNNRTNSNKAKSEEKSWLNKMVRVLKILEE